VRCKFQKENLWITSNIFPRCKVDKTTFCCTFQTSLKSTFSSNGSNGGITPPLWKSFTWDHFYFSHSSHSRTQRIHSNSFSSTSTQPKGFDILIIIPIFITSIGIAWLLYFINDGHQIYRVYKEGKQSETWESAPGIIEYAGVDDNKAYLKFQTVKVKYSYQTPDGLERTGSLISFNPSVTQSQEDEKKTSISNRRKCYGIL